MMFVHNLLQRVQRKRLQTDAVCGTPIEGFFAVIKDFGHHGVERTAKYQIHPAFIFVTVPQVLHIAEEGVVYGTEVLKLVKY